MATNNDSFPLFPGPLVHTPPLFHKLKLLNIFDIFKLQLGKLVYKSINNLGPISNIVNFTMAAEVHGHNTRYATNGNMFTHSVRTRYYGLRCLEIEGKHLWKELPQHIKLCTSIKSFTKHFKNHLISLYNNL